MNVILFVVQYCGVVSLKREEERRAELSTGRQLWVPEAQAITMSWLT